jgi:hypothetical protein
LLLTYHFLFWFKTPLHYAATSYEWIHELHKNSTQFAFLQRRLRKHKLYFSRITVFFAEIKGEQEAHNIGKLFIEKYPQYFDDLDFSIVNLMVYPNIGQILLERQYITAEKYRCAMIFLNNEYVGGYDDIKELHEAGKLKRALEECLQNKVEKEKLPPRALYFNTALNGAAKEIRLGGCVTIYSDGCEECLATINYFRIHGVRKRNICIINVQNEDAHSENQVDEDSSDGETTNLCTAGEIWFNNDFIGWLKDVLSMVEDVDKALTRCLMTPFKRTNAFNRMRHGSNEQVRRDSEDVVLMSKDFQGLIRDFIINNQNHSSIKKNLKLQNAIIKLLVNNHKSDFKVKDNHGNEPFSNSMCEQWFDEKLIEMKASLETKRGYHETIWRDSRTQKAVGLIFKREAYSNRFRIFVAYLVYLLVSIMLFNSTKGKNYQAFSQKVVVEDYLA